MITEIYDDFDMDKIASSGQCFRWTKVDESTYRVIAGSACVYITSLSGDRYEFGCSEAEFADFWRNYLDLGENYRGIRAKIDRGEDPFLWRAAESGKGIRILRQDPWEMLITFIISQNRNIPSIRRSVELLSETCGKVYSDLRGHCYYTFPTPEAVAGLSQEELSGCRLGYRCKYVHAAAVSVLDGEIDLESLRTEEEKKTIEALTGLFGVGVKVANCVSLFGLHHVNAFPVDVWIKRILEREYAKGYPFDRYSPYNGIYQQYMFAYYRGSEPRR